MTLPFPATVFGRAPNSYVRFQFQAGEVVNRTSCTAARQGGITIGIVSRFHRFVRINGTLALHDRDEIVVTC